MATLNLDQKILFEMNFGNRKHTYTTIYTDTPHKLFASLLRCWVGACLSIKEDDNVLDTNFCIIPRYYRNSFLMTIFCMSG